jgi:hypothetical protein
MGSDLPWRISGTRSQHKQRRQPRKRLRRLVSKTFIERKRFVVEESENCRIRLGVNGADFDFAEVSQVIIFPKAVDIRVAIICIASPLNIAVPQEMQRRQSGVGMGEMVGMVNEVKKQAGRLRNAICFSHNSLKIVWRNMFEHVARHVEVDAMNSQPGPPRVGWCLVLDSANSREFFNPGWPEFQQLVPAIHLQQVAIFRLKSLLHLDLVPTQVLQIFLDERETQIWIQVDSENPIRSAKPAGDGEIEPASGADFKKGTCNGRTAMPDNLSAKLHPV